MAEVRRQGAYGEAEQAAGRKGAGRHGQGEAEADRIAKQAALDAVLTKHLQDAEDPAAQQEINNATRACDRAAALPVQKTREAEQVEDLVEGIDGFRTAIHAAPAGGARSPLVTAALYEGDTVAQWTSSPRSYLSRAAAGRLTSRPTTANCARTDSTCSGPRLSLTRLSAHAKAWSKHLEPLSGRPGCRARLAARSP
jgi:hypothetical protein